jgi:hypothetical protein
MWQSSIITTRKRMGSGDSPGLQNRRLASLTSMVRSTRTRFRHLHSALMLEEIISVTK